MATSDASYYPVKGQAYRLTVFFTLVTTGKDVANTLSSLAATVSKDNAAAASASGTPTQVGTTGQVYLDLTAAEMSANTVVVKFSSSLSNAVDVVRVLNPVDLGEFTGRADAQTVVRFEQLVSQMWRDMTANAKSTVISTGVETLYKADGSTAEMTRTNSKGDDTLTRGKAT